MVPLNSWRWNFIKIIKYIETESLIEDEAELAEVIELDDMDAATPKGPKSTTAKESKGTMKLKSTSPLSQQPTMLQAISSNSEPR